MPDLTTLRVPKIVFNIVKKLKVIYMRRKTLVNILKELVKMKQYLIKKIINERMIKEKKLAWLRC